ncbi:MAG TPA: glycosyltransferase family 2 protein [Bacteroidales bacterium]|nr:glycosyltransferase family 2 protein [Bacteroidales bacterium]
MRVAVVILNWNGRRFLEKFLPVVIEMSSDDAEVIVADNASTDDSIFFLQQNFPDIKVIANNENGGFSKGYNDVLEQIDADIFVLLNSDIQVTKNWIKPVVELMKKDPNIAACQPKIKSYINPDYFEYAGAAGGFIDKFGYPFCRGRIFQFIEKDIGQYDDVCEIFWATGACMFVRADIYKKFGGLDEDFFAHMEEIDFCWRIKNAGYKVMYCPHSVIYHIGGGTLPKNSWKKTYLNFRNNLSLLYKNLPIKDLYFVMLVRMFLDFVASLKFLINGDVRDAFAVIKAYAHFYKWLPKFYRKRKCCIHKEVSKIYKGSIVKDFYILNKKKFTDLNLNKIS